MAQVLLRVLDPQTLGVRQLVAGEWVALTGSICFELLRSRNTFAVTRTSVLKLPNFPQSIISPIVHLVSVATRLWTSLLPFSSLEHSSGISGISLGIGLTCSSDIATPLEGRSAGLVAPGQ